MIVGNQLANPSAEPMMPLPYGIDTSLAAKYERGLLNRLFAKLRAAIESRVPAGYEDENGFHFESEASEWS